MGGFLRWRIECQGRGDKEKELRPRMLNGSLSCGH